MNDLWVRQKGETSRAFAAFVVYRDMDPATRSLANVARTLGKTKAAMEYLSSKWSWVARAGAWDDEQDRQKRLGQIRQIEAMAERHAQQTQAIATVLMHPVQVALTRFKALRGLPQDDPRRMELDLAEMTVPQLIEFAASVGRGLPAMVEVERMSRGEPNSLLAAVKAHGAIEEEGEEKKFDRLAEVGAILEGLGLVQSPAGPGADAQVEQVHPAPADGETDGIPSSG